MVHSAMVLARARSSACSSGVSLIWSRRLMTSPFLSYSGFHLGVLPSRFGVREPCSRLRRAKPCFACDQPKAWLWAVKAQAWLAHSKNLFSLYMQPQTPLKSHNLTRDHRSHQVWCTAIVGKPDVRSDTDEDSGLGKIH